MVIKTLDPDPDTLVMLDPDQDSMNPDLQQRTQNQLSGSECVSVSADGRCGKGDIGKGLLLCTCDNGTIAYYVYITVLSNTNQPPPLK